jgi:hypothetical protein
MKKCATDKQNFFKRRNSNHQKHMKKWSPSLAIKETQIKTTLRFYLTPVTGVGKDVGKKEPSYTAGGNAS